MNNIIQKMNIDGHIAMNQNEDIHDDADSDIDIEQNVFLNDSESDSDVEIIENIDEDEDNINENNQPPIRKKDKLKPQKQQNNYNNLLPKNSIIKNVNLNTCSNQKILDVFEKIKQKWIIENYKDVVSAKILLKFSSNLGVNEDYDIDVLNENYKYSMSENMILYKCMISRKLIKDEIDDERGINVKKITEIIHYSHKVLSCLIHARRTMDTSYDTFSNIDETFQKCTTPDLDSKACDDYHKLLLYMFNQLSSEKCGRYQKYVCQQKYINGNATHYWEKKWEIKQFIEKCTNLHSNYEYWLIREKPGNFAKLVDYLEDKDCYGYFPDIERTTGVWAFENLLYHNRHLDQNGRLTWKIYEFGKDIIPSNLIASVYYDQEFTAHKYTPENTFSAWRTIPTPSYDQITRWQFDIYEGHEDEIYDLLLVCIGRLPAPLGKWDKWEVFLFLVGLAGCGKSMILLHVIGKMFDEIDVGHLENENEAKFGWSPFKNKKIIIATEIASTFNMSAQLFQKMVSGEKVTLPSKNNDPIEMTWEAPFAFGGNEMFNLVDKAGAIARRSLVFNVYRPVDEKDKNTQMPSLLAGNIGNLIHKSTCAYLEKREQVGSDSLWHHLSKYFLDQRDTVMGETNPFYSFITSDQVELGEHFFCELHEFRVGYNLHLRQLGISRDRFSKDTYIGPFAKLSGIKGFKIGVKPQIKMETINDQGQLVEDDRPKDYVVGLRMI
jgi:hypothetical protein